MTFCFNRPGLTSMKSASAFQRSVYLPTGNGFRKTKKPQLTSGFVKIGGMFSEHTPSTSKMLSSGDLAVKMIDLTKNFLKSPADIPFRLRSSVLIGLGRSMGSRICSSNWANALSFGVALYQGSAAMQATSGVESQNSGRR